MKTDLIIVILLTVIGLLIIVISHLMWYIKMLKEINKDQVAEIHRSYKSYDRLVDDILKTPEF